MRIIMKENKPFASYRGRNMVDTDHSIERSYTRELGLTRQDYIKLHARMIAQAMQQIINKYRDTEGHYLIYSKGTGSGMAINWRRDRYEDDFNNHAYVMTVFSPSPKPHYKKYDADIRIFVEIQDWMATYIQSKEFNRARLTEESVKGAYSRFTSEEGLCVNLFDGKIKDVNIETIIVD